MWIELLYQFVSGIVIGLSVAIAGVFCVGLWVFVAGYVWHTLDRKMKVVCDVCFRDLKKMNEYHKEHKDELTISK